MWILYLLGIGVAVLIAMATAVTVVGSCMRPRRADCIVVPGAMVHENGMPSSMLAARIANAVRLLREGWGSAIVFTGGRGRSGAIESEAARQFAIHLGAPARALFVETASHTTVENFRGAREVMRAHGWSSCLVSSDPFHILRCLIIAREMGIAAWGAPAFASPGYTALDVRIFYTLRECAGLVRYGLYRLGLSPG